MAALWDVILIILCLSCVFVTWPFRRLSDVSDTSGRAYLPIHGAPRRIRDIPLDTKARPADAVGYKCVATGSEQTASAALHRNCRPVRNAVMSSSAWLEKTNRQPCTTSLHKIHSLSILLRCSYIKKSGANIAVESRSCLPVIAPSVLLLWTQGVPAVPLQTCARTKNAVTISVLD